MTAAVKYKPRRKLAFHRLPFVGTSYHKKAYGISSWDVPLTGGYVGGCMAGSALATSALVYLREEASDETNRFLLGQICATWIDRAESATQEELDVLRGQAVGFMQTISGWLAASVDQFGANLDKADKKAILKRINAGLALDEQAFIDSLPSEE
ncbi:MAG TPA: hypothetical protein DHV63_09630 [Pseudomonas sp.]|nr:hypothetical protein [Pseudomonas sp.]